MLQYLLQVPAHTLAYAARLGWAVAPGGLAFTLGPNHVPDRIRLGRNSTSEFASGRLQSDPVTSDEGLREASTFVGRNGIVLESAERDYRAVAEPMAAAYESIVRIGSATRSGMVTDMWRQAVAAGKAVERESCCFLYALPGCHECAGCPRLRTPGT